MRAPSQTRPLRRAVAILAIGSVGLMVLAAGCGEENALVGGACITGYTECSLQCVDTSTDPNNCGSCGNTCPSRAPCVASICGGKLDGAIDGMSVDGPMSADTSDKDRIFPDGQQNDSGDAQGDVDADAPPVDGCAPPYDTALHCGDCFTVCSGTNDTCRASDGGFACAPLCTLPLSNCGGVCVNRQTDAFNCGVCGKFCASNLCAGGLCQGATAGDVVVIGHDYLSTPAAAAQSRILTNAVFIQRSNPLRVMSYERYGEAAAITTVKGILGTAATQLNRSIAYTVTVTDSDIPMSLTSASQDVLLVYDQKNATAGVLGMLGTSWAATLTTFTKAGGVVVVLDGAAGSPAEMPQFITNAGLLNVSLHTALPLAEPVTVVSASDVVGVGVLSPYGAGVRSVRFTANPPSGTVTYIVRDTMTNDPVVIHRTTP